MHVLLLAAAVLQVLGHTKTVLVLLTSWWVLHEPMSARKAMGMALAVAGMVSYGYFNSSSSSSSSSNSSSSSSLDKLAAVDRSASEQLPLFNRSVKSSQDLPTVVTASQVLGTASVEKRLTAVASSGSLAKSGSMTTINVVAR
jgi:drug/metabolite transporter (DMT)-like permease